MGYSVQLERSSTRLPAPYVAALPAIAGTPLLRQQTLELNAFAEAPADNGVEHRAHAASPVAVDLAALEIEPLPEGRLTFVMIAPLTRDNGVFEFAEAARRLKAQQLDVRFVLVGAQQRGRNAVPRAQVEAWVREGRLEYYSDVDAHAWMKQAHVVVHPLHRGGCSPIVTEAMALGRPCIVSDAPGLAGRVTHYRDGVVVARQSAAALADGMTLIVRTPALLGPWSRAAARTARGGFAGNRCAPDSGAAMEPGARATSKTASQVVRSLAAVAACALLLATLARVEPLTSGLPGAAPVSEPVAAQRAVVASAPAGVVGASTPFAVRYREVAAVAPILVWEDDQSQNRRPKVDLVAVDARRRIDRLKARRVGYLLDIEGERALIDGRAPSFDGIVAGHTKQKAARLSRYNTRVVALESEREVLTTRRLQREAEVKRLSARLAALNYEVHIAEEELAQRAVLHKHALTTRDHHDDAQRTAADLQAQRQSTRDQLAHAEAELANVLRAAEEVEQKLRADAEAAIVKHTADLAEVDAALADNPRRP